MESIERWYQHNFEEKKILGRYIKMNDINKVFGSLNKVPSEVIGQSFEGRDISKLSLGHGNLKVMIWTQMHGNESTGTKALYDVLRFLDQPNKEKELQLIAETILSVLSLQCIPVLNPDGAVAYTRVNAQMIDLNRDVIDKKAPESVLLQEQLKNFNPSYCFNMHDQRTIFSVGCENNPATLSFLAPSVNTEREVTPGRMKTMAVINAMVDELNRHIPNQIGRYTDEFYPTATGDNFQKMGFNTILIESGHYKDDYDREEVRKYTFFALLKGLYHLAINGDDMKEDVLTKYHAIPENETNYTDILIKNVILNNKPVEVSIQFKEVLKSGSISFEPIINKVEPIINFRANTEMSFQNKQFSSQEELLNMLKNSKI